MGLDGNSNPTLPPPGKIPSFSHRIAIVARCLKEDLRRVNRAKIRGQRISCFNLDGKGLVSFLQCVGNVDDTRDPVRDVLFSLLEGSEDPGHGFAKAVVARLVNGSECLGKAL